MNSQVDIPDWSKIPAPTDDGAARHLTGMRIPSVSLGLIEHVFCRYSPVFVVAYPGSERGVEVLMVGTSSQGPGDARG